MKYRIGVDSCPSGWISIANALSHEKEVRNFKTIQHLWEFYKDKPPELILIDIPIGFVEQGSEPRTCDKLARKYLTRARSSSIFPVPCRAAIYADSYEQANEINRRKTGKGVSKQSWNITAKIREMDKLLQNEPEAREIFMESMPEVCFTALNNDNPMVFYKKKKEGIQERLKVLEMKGSLHNSLFPKIMNQFESSHVQEDDVVDALVLSLSASRGETSLRFLPPNYEKDATGLPMRIAYPSF